MMKVLIRLGQCLWISALVALCTAPTANANGPDYAGLVVDFGGRVETRCVSFSGSISGIDALRQHFSLETAFGGGAVCKIGDTGCPGGDASCWCQCPNPNEDCRFWSYWHRDNGDWHFSDAGAKIYQVRHGDVEGWKWAKQSFENPDSEPADRSFEQICAEYLATATPIPTATPSPTPTPIPTDTPLPTYTPEPTVTATSVPDPAITFSVSSNQIEAGQCATLGWKVEHAQAIYLDDQGVTGEESRQICPPAGLHTYRLRVIGLDGSERNRETTLNVIQTATSVMSVASAGTPEATSPNDAGASAIWSTPDVSGAGENVALQPQTPAQSPSPDSSQPGDGASPAPGETAPAQAAPAVVPGETALAMNPVAPTPAPSTQQLQAGPSPEQPAAITTRSDSPPRHDTFRDLLTSKVTWFILLGSTAIGVVGMGGVAFVGAIVVLLLIYRHFSAPGSGVTDDGDRDDRFYDDYGSGG